MNSKEKRYLFIANSCIVDGGASKIFISMYQKMKQRYKYVKMAVTDCDSSNLILDDSKKSKIKLVFNLKNYRILYDFLKNERIDIVFVHNVIPNLSISIWLALKKAKVRVIYTLHQFDMNCPNGSLYSNGKKKICEECIGKKIKYHILKNNCSKKGKVHDIAKFVISVLKGIIRIDSIVEKYIVPSLFLKEKLILEGINPQKINVLGNFIDESLWIDKISLNKNNNIIYFGRFSYEKNIILLLEAMKGLKKRNKKIKLYLVGQGEEIIEYQEYIKKEKLEEEIIIMNGFVSSTELKKVLKDTKISILPSKTYESFGLTIIESIFANVIPLVSNIGGMKEVINNSYGFTFQNENVEDLEAKIIFILENYDTEIKKLLRLKNKIKDKYSINKYFELLEKLGCFE